MRLTVIILVPYFLLSLNLRMHLDLIFYTKVEYAADNILKINSKFYLV